MVRYGFGRAGGGKRHRADSPWAENTPCRQRLRGVMCVLGARARSRSPGTLLPDYHTRQEFTGYIGCPCLQPKALPKASKFWTEPLTRHFPGEWGSTRADCLADCSVWFWHHTWAKPIKRSEERR